VEEVWVVLGIYQSVDGLFQLAFVTQLSVVTYVPVKLIYSAACDSCHYGHKCSFL